MTDPAPSLEEHLIETTAPAEASDSERFRVRDEQSAQWALRMIAHKKRQVDQRIAEAEAERAKIDAWLESVNGPLENDIARLELKLFEYHHEELAADPDRKTIKLPAGTLKSRKSPDKLEIDDNVFLPWAKDNHPDLIRTKVEPDKAAAKKLLKAVPERGVAADAETGEIVPGVVVVAGEVRFTIEVNE